MFGVVVIRRTLNTLIGIEHFHADHVVLNPGATSSQRSLVILIVARRAHVAEHH